MEKTSIQQLALFGGRALFSVPRCVGRPNLGDRQRLHERLDDILDRRWFTNNGTYVQEFESRLSSMTNCAHAVAVCNATIGLQMVLRALDLKGEVIVPAFTFVATAHAIEWEGLTPVFADVDVGTHNADPKDVERLITSRTSAILAVHLWGRPCEINALADIAHRHGLKLIFDAAHGIGCTFQGQPIGSFGDAEVFSFHSTKVVNSIEGGAILTADADLADRLRKLRNFGFAGFDNVVSLGTNGKMNEFEAAMGLSSLEAFPEFVAINRRNLDAYREGLAGLPGLKLISYDEREAHNYHYAIVEVDARACPLTRDELVALLQAENVVARRYFYPGCHRMEPYRTRYPFYLNKLPKTDKLANSVLALPNGTGINEEEISRLCHVLAFAFRHANVIRAQLSSRQSSAAA